MESHINSALSKINQFHDACGIGFIAESSGNPSRRVLELSFKALQNMQHRGAIGADEETGDGVGVLVDIPVPFFTGLVKDKFNVQLKPDEILGIGMVFVPKHFQKTTEKEIKSACQKLKINYIGKRKVPVNNSSLGPTALEICPTILQYFFSLKPGKNKKVESRLYLLRKRIENKLNNKHEKIHFCSLSSKTIVYKGLMRANQLDRFYDDLNHSDFKVRVAIFHERFSTNTVSTWWMAQPFRFLAHNGEINTIKGNRLWMKSREKKLKSSFWKNDLKSLYPIIRMGGSDSFSLDNVLEFLTRSGRSVLEAIMMLIPDPYKYHTKMPRSLKGFFIYHENLMEPWDGPAALVFTDGDHVCAKLDRNGLRPLRYTISRDGLVIMASEAGVVDIQPKDLAQHRHMSAGEVFSLALDGSGIFENDEIKQKIAQSYPYSDFIRKNMIKIKRSKAEDEFMPWAKSPQKYFQHLAIAFGFDEESIQKVLIPMANSGREPIGSMGDDTPPAVMSTVNRKLYDYFKQAFAQVTNPPIDPIREKLVTNLCKYLGSEENILTDEIRFSGVIRITSPILSPLDVNRLKKQYRRFNHRMISCLYEKSISLEQRVKEIIMECEKAVKNGTRILFLSDEDLNQDLLPVPMLLVVSVVHHYLAEKKYRNRVSIIPITADVIDEHQIACLLGMGASAVYPYLAYDIIRHRCQNEKWASHMSNYRYAVEKGLLKIMAKMGISTFSSYHGSMLFNSIGLSKQLQKKYFPYIINIPGSTNLKTLHNLQLKANALAFGNIDTKLPSYGRFQYRKNGELHANSPVHFKKIQNLANNQSALTLHDYQPIMIRDYFQIKKQGNLPIEKVEGSREILKRVGLGAMSFGAISEQAHRTLARGANLVGVRSNSGEGGEHTDRFAHQNPDKSENCYIKQVASGRFGVTPDYLTAAREIQIKIAQGAKPGEGGQLPGNKVTLYIANARGTTPGVPLISPPPHHDIYSIEDLAQLIYDLKQINPKAAVSVKLVAQPGIGIIACGVVKAGADIILVAGGEGGTGSSPLGSLKHTGMPWEFGLKEVHSALLESGLRDRVILRVDGGIKYPNDIIIASLLGAEEYDFGTSALIAIGCIMARQCQKNTCPTGIATQDLDLIQRFKGTPENIANYLNNIASGVRETLAENGIHSLGDIVGRMDLLELNPKYKKSARNIRVLLNQFLIHSDHNELKPSSTVKVKLVKSRMESQLDDRIIQEHRLEIMTHGRAVFRRVVSNTDRAIGTRLSGELSQLHGQGLFKGNIQYRMTGVAGQSLGAYLVDGIELRLKEIDNDYVGKGMNGGLITIRLDKQVRDRRKNMTIIGNTALYGATGGRIHIAGKAGERFAVRNSGATAVVEAIGNHGCEYMTRGTIIVLDSIGQNFGAGMTGGIAFLYSRTKSNLDNLNKNYVKTTELHEDDELLILRLLRSHRFHTRSHIAKDIITHWNKEKIHFSKIVPKAMENINLDKIYNQQASYRMGVLLNE